MFAHHLSLHIVLIVLRIRALLFGFGSHLSGLSERCFPSIRLAHGLIRIRNTPLDHSTFNPNILYNVYTIFKMILVVLCFIHLYCTIPPSFYLWCPCPPPPHLYLYFLFQIWLRDSGPTTGQEGQHQRGLETGQCGQGLTQVWGGTAAST